MILPIPTHLQKFFVPIGNNNSEYQVTGEIHCDCGSNLFHVLESNERQLIKLVCRDCGKELLLFDSGKHGWDGFVCKQDFLDRAKPFTPYCCKKCKRAEFRVKVVIDSQGKQDFVNECVSNDKTFAPEDWVNAFEWIKVTLSCGACLCTEKAWLDFETM